jgi:hypothetical protein
MLGWKGDNNVLERNGEEILMRKVLEMKIELLFVSMVVYYNDCNILLDIMIVMFVLINYFF